MAVTRSHKQPSASNSASASASTTVKARKDKKAAMTALERAKIATKAGGSKHSAFTKQAARTATKMARSAKIADINSHQLANLSATGSERLSQLQDAIKKAQKEQEAINKELERRGIFTNIV